MFRSRFVKLQVVQTWRLTAPAVAPPAHVAHAGGNRGGVLAMGRLSSSERGQGRQEGTGAKPLHASRGFNLKVNWSSDPAVSARISYPYRGYITMHIPKSHSRLGRGDVSGSPYSGEKSIWTRGALRRPGRGGCASMAPSHKQTAPPPPQSLSSVLFFL